MSSPSPLLASWTGKKPIVGMVHLPPLPGSPRYRGHWPGVLEAAVRDARALADGGVDGVMVENFGDAPFYPGRVPAETVAALTAAAVAVRHAVDLPLGINVLRNDGESAVAVALAAGADLVRVNVFTGARLTDQGVLQGIAYQVLRIRARLGAAGVRVLADVAVKHSAPLADYPLAEEVRDAVSRGGADAVLVTGGATGSPVEAAEFRAVRAAAPQTPLWVASGVTPETLPGLAAHADGFIVGTWIKRDGMLDRPVDSERVRRLTDALSAAR